MISRIAYPSAVGSRSGQRSWRCLPSCADRPWLLGEQGVTGFGDLLDVEPGQPAAERAAGREAALRDDLQDRPQCQPVVGREQVDGRAHHCRRPNGQARLDQPGELLGPEPVDPAPEGHIRIGRHLRLHADELLDDRLGRHRHAAEQELAIEERPVERSPAQDRLAVGPGCASCGHQRRG